MSHLEIIIRLFFTIGLGISFTYFFITIQQIKNTFICILLAILDIVLYNIIGGLLLYPILYQWMTK